MTQTTKKEKALNVFETLSAINVNEKTDKIEETGLTYLSWCWAWAATKKSYPDASYEVVKFNGLPYVYDALTGYMVYTNVTIEGTTYEMWLPVMDRHNKAMKGEPYQVTTKKGSYTVPAATMFDINKTIMRCLTKNLAMFGLGLYIYAGEDLPEVEAEEVKVAKAAAKRADDAELQTGLYAAENAQTIEELQNVWKQFPRLQKESQFITKVTQIKANLIKTQQQ